MTGKAAIVAFAIVWEQNGNNRHRLGAIQVIDGDVEEASEKARRIRAKWMESRDGKVRIFIKRKEVLRNGK